MLDSGRVFHLRFKWVNDLSCFHFYIVNWIILPGEFYFLYIVIISKIKKTKKVVYLFKKVLPLVS